MTLSVSDVINVSASLAPQAAAARNLSQPLIVGSSPNIIDTTERLRFYGSLGAVLSDFGSSAPEYLAALNYFSQSPAPSSCYVGFFAQTASAGRLLCAPLTPVQQALSNFTAITTNGALKLKIDGTDVQEVSMSFTSVASMPAVAAVINTAFSGHCTCVWNAAYQRFEFYSDTTGATSSVSFSETNSSGTNIAPLILARSTDGGRVAVGNAVETPLQGVTNAAAFSNAWYAATLAPYTPVMDSDHEAIAAFVQAATPVRTYWTTSQDPSSPNDVGGPDMPTSLMTAGYSRTCVQYSSTSPYAVTSLVGRALTVDYTGNLTAITLKFEQEPGIVPENLTEAQAQTLNSKNCNVFAAYQNGTSIIQQGVMCSGEFIDEVLISDQFANDLQTALYNALYLASTKIPQTDAGVNVLVTTADSICEQYVRNGALAPGVWTGSPVGPLQTGQTLAKGYFVYAQPVAQQSASDRAARKSPPIYVAVKLAGAIHSANVLVTLNR